MKGQQKGFKFYEKNGCLIGQLYNTIVFYHNPDTKTTEFDTGGWETNSTAKAINTSLNMAFLKPKHSARFIKGRVEIDAA